MKPAPGPRRRRDGGEVSPLLLILLILIVALFVFAALAASRGGPGGGLSAGGCLPRDQAGRKAMARRWFETPPLPVKALTLVGCTASGQVLQLRPNCTIEVPASGPDTVWEKIRSAFQRRDRRVAIKAVTPLAIRFKRGEDADVVEAELKGGKETDFAVSRAGATIQLACVGGTNCQVVLEKPPEEP